MAGRVSDDSFSSEHPLNNTTVRRPRADTQTMAIGMLLLQALIIFPLQVISHKWMYADGAHHFLGVLNNQAVLRFDWPRQFSQYIMQTPLVAAIKVLDINTVTILSYVFGATLHLIPLLGVVLGALIFFRSGRKTYVFLIIISYLYLAINTSFFIIYEAHLAAAVFWILLSLLITADDHLSTGKKVGLLLLSFLSIRLHESFIVLGPVLALSAILKFVDLRRRASLTDRMVILGCVPFYLTASIISLNSIIHPWYQANRDGLISSLTRLDFIHNRAFCASSFVFFLALAGILTATLARAGRWTKKSVLVCYAALVIIACAWLPVFAFFGKDLISPDSHYDLRYLTMIVPAAVGLAVLLLDRFRGIPNKIGLSAYSAKIASLAAIILFLWNVFFQVFSCREWTGYLRMFVKQLDNKLGVIELADTPIKNARLNWSYGQPELSLVLSGIFRQGRVQSMVIGDRFKAPFRLSDLASFPALSGYGLRYAAKAFEVQQLHLFESRFKHAVGDFDGDGTEEASVDFGSAGVWLWDSGKWTCLSTSDAHGQIPRHGDSRDGILVNLGARGLWLWSGTWTQLSSKTAACMTVGHLDASPAEDSVIASFSSLGVFVWNGKVWSQLTGDSAEFLSAVDTDGDGVDEIACDFGERGLWVWKAGDWFQISSLDADSLSSGDIDGDKKVEIIADFRSDGLWVWSDHAWITISGIDWDFVGLSTLSETDHKEIFASSCSAGIWLWSKSGWARLRDIPANLICAANIDGDEVDELIADFGNLGLWVLEAGTWVQISTMSARYVFAFAGFSSARDLVWADFREAGIWMWNDGAWVQLSPKQPGIEVMVRRIFFGLSDKG